MKIDFNTLDFTLVDDYLWQAGCDIDDLHYMSIVAGKTCHCHPKSVLEKAEWYESFEVAVIDDCGKVMGIIGYLTIADIDKLYNSLVQCVSVEDYLNTISKFSKK